MTEFTEAVEKRRLMEQAEAWAKETEWLHAHQLKSMWYDTRPADTDNSFVTDIGYKSGLIKRILSNGEEILFGEELKGDELLNKYIRNSR